MENRASDVTGNETFVFFYFARYAPNNSVHYETPIDNKLYVISDYFPILNTKLSLWGAFILNRHKFILHWQLSPSGLEQYRLRKNCLTGNRTKSKLRPSATAFHAATYSAFFHTPKLVYFLCAGIFSFVAFTFQNKPTAAALVAGFNLRARIRKKIICLFCLFMLFSVNNVQIAADG